jgi:DNA-binding transcriptional MerR regulator
MAKLIPDPVVARERYHVHPHTLRRWDQNLALGFPPVIYVNNRRYRDEDQLDAWDRKNSREAATRRAGLTPPSPEAA